MTGPLLLTAAVTTVGALTGGWAGAIVGFGVGLLTITAIVVAAAVWARQIGQLLEHEDAWENAPRPPGFKALVEWVYTRSLRTD